MTPAVRPAPVDPAIQKLVNVLGPAQAEVIISETMRRLGLTRLATPEDRYRFGCELILRGGVLEAIGRAIKIQAILHGAKELSAQLADRPADGLHHALHGPHDRVVLCAHRRTARALPSTNACSALVFASRITNETGERARSSCRRVLLPRFTGETPRTKLRAFFARAPARRRARALAARLRGGSGCLASALLWDERFQPKCRSWGVRDK